MGIQLFVLHRAVDGAQPYVGASERMSTELARSLYRGWAGEQRAALQRLRDVGIAKICSARTCGRYVLYFCAVKEGTTAVCTDEVDSIFAVRQLMEAVQLLGNLYKTPQKAHHAVLRRLQLELPPPTCAAVDAPPAALNVGAAAIDRAVDGIKRLSSATGPTGTAVKDYDESEDPTVLEGFSFREIPVVPVNRQSSRRGHMMEEGLPLEPLDLVSDATSEEATAAAEAVQTAVGGADGVGAPADSGATAEPSQDKLAFTTFDATFGSTTFNPTVPWGAPDVDASSTLPRPDQGTSMALGRSQRRTTEFVASGSSGNPHYGTTNLDNTQGFTSWAEDGQVSSQSMLSSSQRVTADAPSLEVRLLLTEEMSMGVSGGNTPQPCIEGTLSTPAAAMSAAFNLHVIDKASEVIHLSVNNDHVAATDEPMVYRCSIPAVLDQRQEAGSASHYLQLLRYRTAETLRPVPVRIQSRARLERPDRVRLMIQVVVNPALTRPLSSVTVAAQVKVPGVMLTPKFVSKPPQAQYNVVSGVMQWRLAELIPGQREMLESYIGVTLQSAGGGDGESPPSQPVVPVPVIFKCQSVGSTFSKLDFAVSGSSADAGICELHLARRLACCIRT